MQGVTHGSHEHWFPIDNDDSTVVLILNLLTVGQDQES